jgi:hypothetical protein
LTALEDALTRALADRASAAAVVVCAVVAASLMAGAGVTGKPGNKQPDDLAAPGEYVAVSTPMPAALSDLPVDYVNDNLLTLRNGRTFQLPAGEIRLVQRAQDGYVVVEDGPGQTQSAWFLHERSGMLHTVLKDVRSIVVAADGSGRLAWLSGSTMYYREVLFDALPRPYTVRTFDTNRPAHGRPVGFVGGAVLLSDPESDRHDVWFPDRGDYEPTWVGVAAVYGARARGTELVVARSAKKRVCLTTVSIDEPGQDPAGCHFLDRWPTRGWVSPGGRWLVLADRSRAQMIDLTAGWRKAAEVDWKVDEVNAGVAWLDPDKVAVHTSAGVVVLSPFATETAVQYKLPARSVIVNQ